MEEEKKCPSCQKIISGNASGDLFCACDNDGWLLSDTAEPEPQESFHDLYPNVPGNVKKIHKGD